MPSTDASSRRSDDALIAMRRELERSTPVYRTIIAGTDGSATAQEAVRQAVAISRAVGAGLHLVSAAPAESQQQLEHDARDAPEDVRHTINTHGYVEGRLLENIGNSLVLGHLADVSPRLADYVDGCDDGPGEFEHQGSREA
jgi:nucleotide-binding universal stress UspA family protein